MKKVLDKIDKEIAELQAARKKLVGKTTEVIFIVDRSGSMESIKTDMDGQIKGLLEEQEAANPNSTLSVYMFDDKFEVVCENVKITDRPKVEIVPRNMTALYDAVGKALNLSKARITDQKLVIIVTDGAENCSREFGSPQIQNLTKELGEKGYTFVYCGANQDVWSAATSLGVSAKTAMRFSANTAGVANTSDILRSRVASYMTKGTYDSFTTEERNLANQE